MTASLYKESLYAMGRCLVIGILLLLFGLKWLKNAILRYSGQRK
jgi:uncharacterized membrane protein